MYRGGAWVAGKKKYCVTNHLCISFMTHHAEPNHETDISPEKTRAIYTNISSMIQ